MSLEMISKKRMTVDDLIRKHYNPYFKSLSERGKTFYEFLYRGLWDYNNREWDLLECEKRNNYVEFMTNKIFPNGDEKNLFKKYYPFVCEVLKLHKISFDEKRKLIEEYHSLKEYEEWLNTPNTLDEFFQKGTVV